MPLKESRQAMYVNVTLRCIRATIVAVIYSTSYLLNAHFLYSITMYMLNYNSHHVSSSTLLIFRRTNCIITASGIVTLCKRPHSMPVESGLQSALNRHFSNDLQLRSTIIVARSRNHCYNGNITMCFVCIVELHDTVNGIKILNASQKCFCGKSVTCNNKTYVFM